MAPRAPRVALQLAAAGLAALALYQTLSLSSTGAGAEQRSALALRTDVVVSAARAEAHQRLPQCAAAFLLSPAPDEDAAGEVLHGWRARRAALLARPCAPEQRTEGDGIVVALKLCDGTGDCHLQLLAQRASAGYTWVAHPSDIRDGGSGGLARLAALPADAGRTLRETEAIVEVDALLRLRLPPLLTCDRRRAEAFLQAHPADMSPEVRCVWGWMGRRERRGGGKENESLLASKHALSLTFFAIGRRGPLLSLSWPPALNSLARSGEAIPGTGRRPASARGGRASRAGPHLLAVQWHASRLVRRCSVDVV